MMLRRLGHPPSNVMCPPKTHRCQHTDFKRLCDMPISGPRSRRRREDLKLLVDAAGEALVNEAAQAIAQKAMADRDTAPYPCCSIPRTPISHACTMKRQVAVMAISKERDGHIEGACRGRPRQRSRASEAYRCRGRRFR